MNVLLVAVPIVSTVCAVLMLAIDHRWSDRKTRAYRRLRAATLWAIVCAGVLGVVTTWGDLDARANLMSALEESRSEVRQQRKQAEGLQRSIEELQQDLYPFAAFAAETYPHLNQSEALKLLASDVEALSARGEDQERKLQEAEGRIRQLQRQAAPRSISDASAEAFLKDLSLYKDAKIGIVVPYDPEALAFARELHGVLTRAGLKVAVPRPAMLGGEPKTGIVIQVKRRDSIPPIARVFENLFEEAGLEHSGSVNPSIEEGSVVLIVGVK